MKKVLLPKSLDTGQFWKNYLKAGAPGTRQVCLNGGPIRPWKALQCGNFII